MIPQLKEELTLADKEVRFGVVLYGGVSLTIYINGVTQELLSLVRSTALPPDRLSPSELIYRELAMSFDSEATEPPVRFLVDVVAGTSAGGINGVFLSKALSQGQTMDQIKQLWVEKGDIDTLLNDEQSIKPLPRYQLQQPAQSLLNSQAMYAHLLKALEAMDGAEPASKPLVDDLDLFITATDLEGLILPLQLSLSDQIVFERRHKAVFHFSHQNPAASRFDKSFNPQMAFAARCTSAFPLAFEPMTQQDTTEVIKTENLAPTPAHWNTLFEDFLPDKLSSIPVPQNEYAQRSFADGGYLDNKPFTHAIQQMEGRVSSLPVQRKLIYIEPDPSDPTFSPAWRRRPNAVDNSWLALSTLPRYETIREDLQRVLKRNQEVGRVLAIRKYIDELHQTQAFIDRRIARRNNTVKRQKWVEMDSGELALDRGEAYLGYHRLKVSATTDILINALIDYLDIDRSSPLTSAIEDLVRQWRNNTYGPWLTPRDGKLDKLNLFLNEFSVDFRSRRLNYLLSRLDRWLLPDSGLSKDKKAALRILRSTISSLYTEALAWKPQPQDFAPLGNPEELTGFLMTQVFGDDNSQQPTGRNQMLATLSDKQVDQNIAAAATLLSKRLAEGYATSYRQLRALLQPELPTPEMNSLWDDYMNFEDIDVHFFPTLFNSGFTELAEVEVIRVSPADAKGPLLNGAPIVDEFRNAQAGFTALDPGNKRKLKGASLGAFGGFLEEEWRRNDMLWGRLDGAERLISTLVQDARLRQSLIERIHHTILKEELENNPLVRNANLPAGLSPEEIFLRYRELLQVAPARERSVNTIARSLQIVSEITENLTNPAKATTASKLLLWTGKIVTGLAALASQKTIIGGFTRHWLRLVYLASVLLILLGIFYSPASSVGWILFTVTASLHLAIGLLRDYLTEGNALVRLLLAFTLFAILLLAAIGFAQLPTFLKGVHFDTNILGWASIALSVFVLACAATIKSILSSKLLSPAAMLSLESVSTLAAVETITGDLFDKRRQLLRLAISWDNAMLIAYGNFFLLQGILCALQPSPWQLYTGIALSLFGILAASFDFAENSRISRILSLTLRELTDNANSFPASASTYKWLFFGLASTLESAWLAFGCRTWWSLPAIAIFFLALFAFQQAERGMMNKFTKS